VHVINTKFMTMRYISDITKKKKIFFLFKRNEEQVAHHTKNY